MVVLTVGYHCFTRGFAYIGVPAANVYIGEIVFAAALLTKPDMILGRWLSGLVAPSRLSATCFFILGSLGYGAWQTARGMLLGYPALTALQNFVFDYYPLYFFIGLWASAKDPSLLPRVIRVLACVSAIYGIIYVLFLQPPPNEFIDPSEASGSFGLTQPTSAAYSLLAMICFGHTRWRDSPILLLNAFTLLALQVRAEWLALVVAGTLWAVLNRRVGRAVALAAMFVALLATIQLVGINMEGRIGNVTFTETAARIVAPFSADLATRLSPEHVGSHVGTGQFRTDWWTLVWTNVNTDPTRFMFGYGFGFPLRSLVYNADTTEMMSVRTPHNVFFYAFGYTGWIGVLLFFGMQASIGLLAWRTFKETGQSFAIAYWVASFVVSFLSNLFETPFGAIPFYLVMGMAVAPVVVPRHVARASPTKPFPQRAGGSRPVPARVGW